MTGCGWTEYKSETFATGGGQLQAAQMFGPRLWQPAQQGGKITTLEHLLDGPQAVGRLVAAD